MALVKCKECGSETSNRALACVKCGAPYPGKSWFEQPGSGCGVVVLGFIAFAAVVTAWIWISHQL